MAIYVIIRTAIILVTIMVVITVVNGVIRKRKGKKFFRTQEEAKQDFASYRGK